MAWTELARAQHKRKTKRFEPGLDRTLLFLPLARRWFACRDQAASHPTGQHRRPWSALLKRSTNWDSIIPLRRTRDGRKARNPKTC